MALPKLNSTPKYTMKIPTTQENVAFRPFLIKEEKTMLIAAESGNPRNVLMSMIDTLKACCDDDINLKKLATFDIEYMFLQLRSKSVGETATVGITCEDCGHKNKLEVNLEDIKIKVPEKIEKVVELTDQIKVELDYPSYHDILSSDSADNITGAEQLFELMNFVFKTVITNDERINLKEVSKKELTDFIDSMDSKQFSKIKDFIQEIPKLKHDYELTCEGCSKQIKNTLEGLTNFLS